MALPEFQPLALVVRCQRFEKPGAQDAMHVYIQYEHGGNLVGGFARISSTLLVWMSGVPGNRLWCPAESAVQHVVEYAVKYYAMECMEEDEVLGRQPEVQCSSGSC